MQHICADRPHVRAKSPVIHISSGNRAIFIWLQSNYREIYYGHYHKEMTNDDYGVVTRQIVAPKLNDPYEKTNGYTIAAYKLQIFKYGIDKLKVAYEI